MSDSTTDTGAMDRGGVDTLVRIAEALEALVQITAQQAQATEALLMALTEPGEEEPTQLVTMSGERIALPNA